MNTCQMFLYLAICTAAAICIIIDMLIGDAGRVRLTGYFVIVWNRLDDARRRSVRYWLKIRAARKWILLIASTLALTYIIWAYTNRVDPHAPVGWIEVLIAAICVSLGLLIIHTVLPAKSLLRAFVRASILLVIVLLPAVGVGWFTYSNWGDIKNVQATPTVLQLVWLIMWISMFVLTPLVFIVWLVIALPVFALYGLRVLLTVIEFLARRIIEYPKGPLLAISILLEAVVTALSWLK